MKIGIIGTGYIGLTEGLCFASLGQHVICYDIIKEKIEQLNKGLKKSNTSKILQIKIQNCYNNLKATKIGNNIINNHSIKTNINSPIGSDREEKQIINLNHELTNKKNEINKLKERINEKNKY